MPEIIAAQAADLARLRSVQHIRGGRTAATQDQVREYRDGDGRWVKVIEDQLRNRVRMRHNGQDVKILNAPLVVGRYENGRFVNVGAL
ncbi:hypothetical protein ABT294_00550 [Nonomuraea sp. NPDC000554]|uniref:hypothetical protein n=1 Tax=Nonomuraea sp. NPDC000554 TaxID=3154259 RepID=UPI003332D329